MSGNKTKQPQAIPRRGAAAASASSDADQTGATDEQALDPSLEAKGGDTAAADPAAEQSTVSPAAAAAPPGAPVAKNDKELNMERAYQTGTEYLLDGRMAVSTAARDMAASFGVDVNVAAREFEKRLAAAKEKRELEAGDAVMCNIPKAYKLTLSSTNIREIKAGVRPLPRVIAEHWWSKAQGVSIVGEETGDGK